MSGNPFVGPRPLGSGDPIFGRDREIFELRNLLCAERIVLLYSPSGAGKSSLMAAGLIPQLKTRFDVWTPTRVNLQPPGEVKVANRYVWSAAAGFEQEVPERLRRPPESFAAGTLQEYVNARPRRPGAPRNVLLIFDQFEEILRVNPLAMEEKRDFFSQLGDVLTDLRVWALFAMREDYLAPLDPFCGALPTNLRYRYRIDLLGLEAAAEAIARPAAEAHREFAKGAIDKLLTDLAAVKVQQPDGTFQVCTGINVEPMQLQVVCRGLWDRMPADAKVILLEHVEKFGDTTRALSAYYAGELTRITGGDTIQERSVRDWIESRLITHDGIRSLVMRTAGSSEGLANDLIAQLVDTHLVRAEQRAGTVWYELAHDRLVDPVRRDNAEWRDAHLHKVQKLAALWDAQGRPEGLLLTGMSLRAAEQWAQSNRETVTQAEREFLAASSAKHAAMEREKREARRIRIAAAIATLAFIVASVVAFYAYRQSKVAESRELAANAVSQPDTTLALIMALSAMKSSPTREALEALEFAWQRVRGARFTGHLGNINAISWSADGRFLASGGDDGTARLWNATSGKELGIQPLIQLQNTPVRSVAFNGDGSRVAIAANDGVVRLVNRASTAKPTLFTGCAAPAMDVKFSPDSTQLAASCGDNTAVLWNVGSGQIAGQFKGHSDLIDAIAFDPAGKLLATAGKDRKTTIWAIATGRSRRVLKFSGPVTDVSFSPDGRNIATTTLEGLLKVWKTGSWSPLYQPVAHFDGATSVDFSADGTLLATGGLDGDAKLWHVAGGDTFMTFYSQDAAAAHVAFERSAAKQLAVASGEKIWLYDLDFDSLQSQAVQYVRGKKLIPRTQNECSQYFHSQTCPTF